MKPKHSDRSQTMFATTSSPDSNNAAKTSPSVSRELSLRQGKLSNDLLSKTRKRIIKFAYHERPGRQRIFKVRVENTHTAEDVKVLLAKELSEGFPAVDMTNKTIRITQGWNEVSDELHSSAETLYTVHVLPKKQTWLPLRVTLSTGQNDRSKDDQNFMIFTPQRSEVKQVREEIAKLASYPPQSLEVKLPQGTRKEHWLDTENNNLDDSGIDSDEDDKPDDVIVSDEATLNELLTCFPANSLIRVRVNSLLSFRVEVTVDVAREVTVLKMDAYEHDSVDSILQLVAAEMAVNSSCVRIYSLNEAVNPGRIIRYYSQRNKGKFTAHVFTKAAEIHVQHYQKIFSYQLFVTDATATSVDELERFVEKKHKFRLHSVELHNDQGRLKAESTIAGLGLGRNDPVIVHTKVPEKALEVPSKHHLPEDRIFEIDSEIPRGKQEESGTDGEDKDSVGQSPDFPPLHSSSACRPSPYSSTEELLGGGDCQEPLQRKTASEAAWTDGQGATRWRKPEPGQRTSSACACLPPGAALEGHCNAVPRTWTADCHSRESIPSRPSDSCESPRRSSGFRFYKEDERIRQTQHQKDASFSKLQEETIESDACQVEAPGIPHGEATSARSTHRGKLSAAQEDLAEKYPPDHTARTNTRQVPQDHCHTNQIDYMDEAMDSASIIPRGNHNHAVLPREDSTNILGLMGATYPRFDDSENDNMMTTIESKVCLQSNRYVAHKVTAWRVNQKAAEDPKIAKAISDYFPSLGQLGFPSAATPAPEPAGIVSDKVLRTVAENIGPGWMSLCLHLGVYTKDLDRINHNYSDLWEKAFQGLLRWKGMYAGEATPTALKIGLMQKDFRNVADLIKSEKEEAAGGESVSPE